MSQQKYKMRKLIPHGLLIFKLHTDLFVLHYSGNQEQQEMEQSDTAQPSELERNKKQKTKKGKKNLQSPKNGTL